MLQGYFRSGWGFFIPYLVMYLLYAWLKWPVNPGVGIQSGWMPCLLHLYWFLHGLHLILGVLALRIWWRHKRRVEGPGQAAGLPAPISSVAQAAVPWFCLALFFWIPGMYLEWPSDPWEHLRRINEWQALDQVTAHSTWKKSSYFLPYSLTGHFPAAVSQLKWLNLYYTGICLLLCWQYYRLARVTGLGSRGSFVFVLINAVTFGNNVFSFYRYYGLSSSIVAQLGIVAVACLTLEAVRGSPTPTPRFPLRRSVAGCLLLLLPLIAFNHLQGIAIVGLNLAALAVWRMLDWKRSAGYWILAAILVLSAAAILWYPRHAFLDSVYRTEGWLSSWYGFNFFQWNSPAAENAKYILGAAGLANLAAGLLLIRKNHVVGWLTLLPVIALAAPIIAIPFTSILAAYNPAGIWTFNRMFFAIPAGLALVHWIGQSRIASAVGHRHGFLPVILVAMAAIVLPVQHPSYNRLAHSLVRTPDDLRMTPLIAMMQPVRERLRSEDVVLVSTGAVASILNATSPEHAYSDRRSQIARPAADSLPHGVAVARSSRPTDDRQIRPLLSAAESSQPAAWIAAGGAPLGSAPANTRFGSTVATLQNPAGQSLDMFTVKLFPIDLALQYRIEVTGKQRTDTAATAYLAVAWYDENGRLLAANISPPEGAGNPRGWNNGTYSYFGLNGTKVPTAWTTYRISFGNGEVAMIPPLARFFRLGVRLNYNSTPDAVVDLSNLLVWRKTGPELIADGIFPGTQSVLIAAPPGQAMTTPYSQFARLSGHWPDQQAASDVAGGPELAAAAKTRGGVDLDPAGAIFEVPKGTDFPPAPAGN
jgi:hypothetical protein